MNKPSSKSRPAPSSAEEGEPIERSGFGYFVEKGVHLLFFTCAAITVLITVGIIFSLLFDAITFFQKSSFLDFLTGSNWSPGIKPYSFGILPLISGTLIITIGSAAVGLPLGLAAAVYLSEYASSTVRSVLKPMLEVLAGIPTIVYGYFALVYITPALQTFIPLETFNALSASIVVGIMIIPMVSSVSEDALSSVPDHLRQAGYGLGATKFHVTTRVVVPSAFSGILSSFVLAVSRALGETMAVTIAAGQSPQLPYFPNLFLNFTESIETLTAAMIEVGVSDITGRTPAYYSMFALGLVLFLLTFSMNLLAEYIRRSFWEDYG